MRHSRPKPGLIKVSGAKHVARHQRSLAFNHQASWNSFYLSKLFKWLEECSFRKERRLRLMPFFASSFPLQVLVHLHGEHLRKKRSSGWVKVEEGSFSSTGTYNGT